MGYYGLIIPSVFPTGVFIQDIKQTASSNESEGVNTMTVTLTNQQKAHFNVKNGKQGSTAEATAQMEQHAKEYIATEFTKQKTKLDQYIAETKADFDRKIESIETNFKDEISSIVENEIYNIRGSINKIIDDKIYKNIDSEIREGVDGYIKIKDNLIIQFFKIKANDTFDNQATFPFPFPKEVLTITSSLIVNDDVPNPDVANTFYIWNKTRIGFNFSSATYSETSGSYWNRAEYDIIAIGY